jgi:hypothetical protein
MLSALSMSPDWNESTCWMDHYRRALERRRGQGWRRLRTRLDKKVVAVGMLLATAAAILYHFVPV